MSDTPAGTFRRIVWPLAVAETIVWAAMYYSFPALLLEWEADLGWSKTELTGALTLSLLVSAASSPFAGRIIDHGHGRVLLTGSALSGAILLVLLSQVTSLWQFYAVWILIGLAMSGCLYDACFAILTHTMGDQAKRAITLVTLVAGLAGTVSFPSANALASLFGWRVALDVFALVIVVVAVPLFWHASGRAHSHSRHEPLPVGRKLDAGLRLIRSPLFWCLALCFVTMAVNHGVIINHLLPILDARGVHNETAILAISMIGPMQVAGRLAMMAAERHVATSFIFMTCTFAAAIASLSLYWAAAIPALLVSFVLLQGAGHGVVSIVRPVIIADYLGRQDFGLVSGVLASFFMVGSAFAPTIGSVIWEWGGYDRVIQFTFAIALVAFCTLVVARLIAGR
ncbi:MAG: MFS transporter [Hyphomicrobiaceae bacterium]|nr:MFS transporter [Hyphomicrobiaceae bacterium]